MPRLSDTMTEGVIAAWHKKVGESVAAGDLLAEIETDKATMDLESFFDGILLHIGVAEGDGIPVGDLLVIIGEKGEDVSGIIKEFEDTQKAETAEAPAEEAPAPKKEVAPVVEAAPVSVAPTPVVETASSSGVVGEEKYEEVRVSQMRKTIARRLSESKFSAPHFYLTMEINMDRAVESRKAMNEIAPVKISFNDIVLKATAAALKQHPKVNASWQGDTIRYNEHVNIGVAVAVDEGLLVPVVRFADSKGLAAISQEVRSLAGKARSKKLQPSEWEGSTFTISNLGMYGIEEFTAIINPPDACILAIGGINQKPIVKDGQVVPGSVMKVTMSCDHRVVDGATGSEFLVTLKKLLEDPVRILI
ncbi:UNVERIFIED_CONTAM: hypothetical protein GTU68_024334 [Idotea baltica]|nr:hypothetical protein [Idotea baltica]